MRIPPDTVLVVIDVQRAIDDPSWGPRNNPDADGRVAALLDTWRAAGFPVIHVRHDSVHPDSPYRPGQPLHAFKPCAAPQADEPVVAKRTGSAFVDTDLQDRLEAAGSTTLVVCGVLTQNSVATTVRHAGCLGFRAFVVADACQAADVVDAAGRRWPADEVHALALAELDGEYARVIDTERAVAAARLTASRPGWAHARRAK